MNSQTDSFRAHWSVLVLLLVSIPVLATAQKKQAPSKPTTTTQTRFVANLIYDPVLYPVPIVQIRINGSAPLPFLIDTGSSLPLVIDSWAAKQLKLTLSGHTLSINGGAKLGDTAALRNVEILCASTSAKRPIAYPLAIPVCGVVEDLLPVDYPAPSRIAGIVGIPALSSETVTFDFAAKKLTLSAVELLPSKINGATVLHLKSRNALFTVAIPTANNRTADFLLDTGSDNTVISETVASNFKFTDTPTVLSGRWIIGDLIKVNTHLIPDLVVGDRLEHNVVILSVAKDEQEATFGMGLLSRFRMTLDVPHRQLLLEPATDYGDRCRLPGLPGIWAARTRNQYTVEEVLPNSTAAKAGIQLGDRILSIDGTIPTLLPERTISYVLDGIAGTQADLWVARKDNSQLHIRYVRQSLFAMASGRDFGTGIATTITDSGKMLVAGLMHHSPAGEAGI